jgi:hypothetical protein
MPFKKGESGNPNGKPKGAKGKVSSKARELFVQVMEGEMENIQDSLAVLRENSDEKYLKALSSLMPYFMPKQQETEIKFDEAVKPPSWFDEVLEREDHDGKSKLID